MIRLASSCRAAQRAFRARKKEKERAKEEELRDLTAKLAAAELEARALQQRNSLLEAAVVASRRIAADEELAGAASLSRGGSGASGQVCMRMHRGTTLAAKHGLGSSAGPDRWRAQSSQGKGSQAWHALYCALSCCRQRRAGSSGREMAGATTPTGASRTCWS